KIEAKGTKPVTKFDLGKMSSEELVGLLANQNEWFAHEARRILAERRDTNVIPILRTQIFETKEDHLALESLWTLYVSSGLENEFALKTLGHRSGYVRAWTVRLLTDSSSDFVFKTDPPYFLAGGRSPSATLHSLDRK